MLLMPKTIPLSKALLQMQLSKYQSLMKLGSTMYVLRKRSKCSKNLRYLLQSDESLELARPEHSRS